jgi:hypothetical protein
MMMRMKYTQKQGNEARKIRMMVKFIQGFLLAHIFSYYDSEGLENSCFYCKSVSAFFPTTKHLLVLQLLMFHKPAKESFFKDTKSSQKSPLKINL